MNDELERFLTLIPEREPLTYKAIYPRRITPPGGYLNPKYFAPSLWSSIRVGFNAEMNMLPHVTGLVNALTQLAYGVPTYFVRSEFAQAVAQTEPPDDFKFSEIKWPMPAMTFVLPTSFVLSYFGFMCPFLSISHAVVGRYPMVLKNLLPKCEMPVHSVNVIENTVERFNIIYPVYSKSTPPVDYTGSYPLSMNVNEISTAPFQDATYMEEERLNQFGDYALNRNLPDLPAEGEAETLFSLKVQSFAVKLMLALTAQPEFIETGSLSRPAKMKHGRQRDELWNPNLIGWSYQAKRVGATTGASGTHASPRLHWRRGHMRNQPYGPKPWTETSLKKLLWIKPVLICASE